jgi:hypothetical protein
MLTQRFVAPMVAACLAVSSFAACDDDDDLIIPETTLLVVNESDFVIEELYITDVGNPSFGPNLLAGDALLPGEEILLGVLCDFYDVLIVDEAGVECEIDAIDLCLNDATFVIRNETCSVFSQGTPTRAEPSLPDVTETAQ